MYIKLDIINGSRTIAPEEKCPPKTNPNSNPNPNPNGGAIFFGGNCPDTIINTFLLPPLFVKKFISFLFLGYYTTVSHNVCLHFVPKWSDTL